MWNFAALNWLAILTATAAAFALGGLWYGPILGKAWLTALGKRPEDLEPSPKPFIISAIAALVTAIVLGLLIQALGIVTIADGALIGLAVGVGFITTAMASDSAFCGWGLNLFLIQSGYRVAYSVIIGIILAAWS